MRSPLRRHKTWDLFSCSSPMRSVFRAVCDGSGKNYTNSRAIANLPVQINCQSFGILSRCKSATDEAAAKIGECGPYLCMPGGFAARWTMGQRYINPFRPIQHDIKITPDLEEP